MSAPRRVLRRARVGERIAAASALVLVASTFMEWFEAELSSNNLLILIRFFARGNAWQSLGAVPWLLLVVALGALVPAVLSSRGSSWKPAIPPNAAVAVFGGLATLLVLLRIVFPPDYGPVNHIPVVTNVLLGAWLALIAAAGIAYGGYRAMGEGGDSFESIAERLSGKRGVSRARG